MISPPGIGALHADFIVSLPGGVSPVQAPIELDVRDVVGILHPAGDLHRDIVSGQAGGLDHLVDDRTCVGTGVSGRLAGGHAIDGPGCSKVAGDVELVGPGEVVVVAPGQHRL